MVNLIALAEGQDTTDPDWPLVLRRVSGWSPPQGGRAVRTSPWAGHWSGRSAGVSVPVGHSRVRVRVGKSAGTFVQGAETPTVIDTGNASITTQRVVFQGDKYTREWDYSKLIGIIHYSDHPATAIQVSNRQKTSGHRLCRSGLDGADPPGLDRSRRHLPRRDGGDDQGATRRTDPTRCHAARARRQSSRDSRRKDTTARHAT